MGTWVSGVFFRKCLGLGELPGKGGGGSKKGKKRLGGGEEVPFFLFDFWGLKDFFRLKSVTFTWESCRPPWVNAVKI